ncbi:hypothetical protein VTK73DRAFT_6970 [Phialemonium thermophilum]|uniref:Heterokaryon incompatibility domain-containing protein n=1 Tax=Phialemonium thermophilum TaxID=223376 RepID=A0ABR3WH32_9PEZI
MFMHEPTDSVSWAHPDPDFDHSRIPYPPTLPPPGFSPEYEALSYVWGSPDSPEIALVRNVATMANGRPETIALTGKSFLPLFITRNLAGALRHLRRSDKARTLWIDAICINQEDKGERNHQVLRVTSVYTLAKRVIVWLGPEADSSGLAMSTLQYLGRQIEVSSDTLRFAAPDATEPAWHRTEVSLPYSSAVWAAILALFERAYFDRVWVAQEVILANPEAVVLCGHDESSWHTFSRAIVCLVTKQDVSPDLRRRLERARTLTWAPLDISLFFVLHLMRTRLCSDPRDKVYAALGITPPGFARLIKPNYQLPIAEVYKNAFLAALEHSKRLVLLQDCELQARSVVGLPTWVPDWSVPRQSHLLSAFAFASGMSRSHHKFIAPDTLAVLGRRVATLRHASGAGPETPEEVVSHVRAWEPSGLFTDSYAAGGSLLDAFLSALRVGYVYERFPLGSASHLAEWREFYTNKFRVAVGATDKEEVAHDKESYWTTVFAKYRSFITTDQGHVGLGPTGALPGDIACSILGCNTNIILREAPDGRYSVVGECYIEGLDDAVGILGPLPEGWTKVAGKDSDGYTVHNFKNQSTGVITSEDPRVPPLLPPWRALERERDPGCPAVWACFENTTSGEVIDTDPRMLPDALEQRGVKLETFKLC